MFYFVLIVSIQLTSDAGTINVLEEGTYPVATSNMDVNSPNPYPVNTYMVGSTDFEPTYLNEIMCHPDTCLSILLDVPNDVALYGSYAGTQLPVVGYIAYPTKADNPRETYKFPFLQLENTDFPHMDRPGDDPIFAKENERYPLIISAHGHKSHGLWDLGHMKFLASQGYIALSIFYGDGRIAEYEAQYTFRTLITKAFLNYLLAHPLYGKYVDNSKIGISGSSFGGYTGLSVLGGRYKGHPSSVVDTRIKAAFLTVPWVGNDNVDKPFSDNYESLKEVTAPVMAILGAQDQIAYPDYAIDALRKLSGPTLVYQMNGEGHAFSREAWLETQTWEVLFFDTYLRGSSITSEILWADTRVAGSAADHKVFESRPDKNLPSGIVVGE